MPPAAPAGTAKQAPVSPVADQTDDHRIRPTSETVPAALHGAGRPAGARAPA